jgi:MFS family permease
VLAAAAHWLGRPSEKGAMTATAEVAREPAPAQLSKGRVNAVFGAVLLGMLLAALDQTIVGTALPTIVGDPGHLSWVVTSDLLAETIMTVVVGKLGDLFGRKPMFQLSVIVFGIGSFCAGFADSMTWLITWRANALAATSTRAVSGVCCRSTCANAGASRQRSRRRCSNRRSTGWS